MYLLVLSNKSWGGLGAWRLNSSWIWMVNYMHRVSFPSCLLSRPHGSFRRADEKSFQWLILRLFSNTFQLLKLWRAEWHDDWVTAELKRICKDGHRPTFKALSHNLLVNVNVNVNVNFSLYFIFNWAPRLEGILGGVDIWGWIQKFPDWPPGAITANSTALCQ